ncbi:inactive protein RESTRICTED TEV MOVEMENT 2-like [Macadamia integrifolia]|uniref:inactive protein RESTRICTED TEV MOVEMENT 2-like n=1 Tax=Macadamia integrifolia TaxID=60698 RepID=UPI001C4E7F06|nr:inactive protein RESTRICTED TEV MOVEMENT 2-like [Macadamia integrifolia]
MEGKAKANCNLRRSYEEFKPSLNWNKEEGHDTLVIHLPGFKKDQINVQIDYLSNLKINGERPLEENRWSRFHKNFRIPNDCDADGIHAKFRGELLSITMPKKSTQQKKIEFRLGGFVLRWSKPLKVVLSVFVAIVVLVALGIYAANML